MVRAVGRRGFDALPETTRFTSALAGADATAFNFALWSQSGVPTFFGTTKDGINASWCKVSDAGTADAYPYQASATIRGYHHQHSAFTLLAARRSSGAGLEVRPGGGSRTLFIRFHRVTRAMMWFPPQPQR